MKSLLTTDLSFVIGLPSYTPRITFRYFVLGVPSCRVCAVVFDAPTTTIRGVRQSVNPTMDGPRTALSRNCSFRKNGTAKGKKRFYILHLFWRQTKCEHTHCQILLIKISEFWHTTANTTGFLDG